MSLQRFQAAVRLVFCYSQATTGLMAISNSTFLNGDIDFYHLLGRVEEYKADIGHLRFLFSFCIFFFDIFFVAVAENV